MQFYVCSATSGKHSIFSIFSTRVFSPKDERYSKSAEKPQEIIDLKLLSEQENKDNERLLNV